jgi:hypothetical protein
VLYDPADDFTGRLGAWYPKNGITLASGKIASWAPRYGASGPLANAVAVDQPVEGMTAGGKDALVFSGGQCLFGALGAETDYQYFSVVMALHETAAGAARIWAARDTADNIACNSNYITATSAALLSVSPSRTATASGASAVWGFQAGVNGANNEAWGNLSGLVAYPSTDTARLIRDLFVGGIEATGATGLNAKLGPLWVFGGSSPVDLEATCVKMQSLGW